MRCPNCSFQNPDGADECKICGYELETNSTPKSNSKRRFDDDDSLDKSFDELFGATETKSSKSRFGSKKLEERFEEYAAMPEDEDEVIDTLTPKNDAFESALPDDLHWLENLQKDIAEVENEFDTLRYKRPSTKFIHDPSDVDPDENVDDGDDKGADDNVVGGENSAHDDTEDADDENVINLNFIVREPIVPEASFEPKYEAKIESKFEPKLDAKFEAKPASKSKRAIAFEESEDDPSFFDTLEDEDYKESSSLHNPNAKRNRIIVIAILVVIVILFALKLTTKPDANKNTDTETDLPTTETPATTDNTSTATDDYNTAISEQVGLFFSQLQAYTNNGNINVLSLFVDSQAALEQLSTFKKQGSIDDFQITMPEIQNPGDLSQPNIITDIWVDVDMTRTADSKTQTSSSRWQFVWSYLEEQWRIDSLVIESGSGTISVDNNNPTTDTTTPTTTTPNTTPSETTDTTTAVRPEGFIASGTFTGGIITDGQDVSQIRFGKHETFDRLVFDLSKWIGTTPVEMVDEACHYSTNISADGMTITLNLNGVRGVSAGSPDLRHSELINSVVASFPEDDSAVTFTIKLNQKTDYKVFTLSNPGKIVVDMAIHE